MTTSDSADATPADIDLAHVRAWTDGACLGNPGPGGYGAVLLYTSATRGEVRRELSAGYRLTTNNRMELLAVITALRSLTRRCRVDIHSDSQYVVRGMAEGWARKWQASNWTRREKGRLVAVPNADLWRDLLALCEQHLVAFTWVRGHAGDILNERADALSVAAAQGQDLLVDEGYETQRSNAGFDIEKATRA